MAHWYLFPKNSYRQLIVLSLRAAVSPHFSSVSPLSCSSALRAITLVRSEKESLGTSINGLKFTKVYKNTFCLKKFHGRSELQTCKQG